MPTLSATLWHMSKPTPARRNASLIWNHGINVSDLAAPHRLAERGW